MDRMTSLRVFREVVEAGSFVAAAERLGISERTLRYRLADMRAAA